MEQYTHTVTIRVTEIQKKTLDKLTDYKVNRQQFIRAAIREKLQRDYKSIREKPPRVKCPY